MTATDTHRAIDAVFRIEQAKLIAGLARMVRDVGLAEELAQDALVVALEQWPAIGHPRQARRLADGRRQASRHRPAAARASCIERKHEELGRELEAEGEGAEPDLDAALDDDIGDDLLRLIFTACHPVLATEARVALTLRLIGGLTTDEIARAFLVAGADHRSAHRARQADAGREAHPLRGAARRGAGRAPRLGAGGDLPRLQRRLLGDRRRRLDAAAAVRGGAAPRPHSGRAGARTSPRCTASSR